LTVFRRSCHHPRKAFDVDASIDPLVLGDVHRRDGRLTVDGEGAQRRAVDAEEEGCLLFGPAKGKDFGTSLGPWIVTADELAPFLDADGFLAIRAEVFVNDDLIGHDLVSNMGWPFSELVAYASRNSRIVPATCSAQAR
jgi:2-keto-4-pentenoate hydratase/2-oxohepta-3-ene-1,7-dioic acid hydratase in catechol pathway